ncbi:hypothetical protein [Mariprofundus sp. NF]|uniref:hypothetical protein n=1 Tax=Mariprofundus sp. NF TaxID=2608716 RepID=UPI0015A13852|nr:hypothetical protein [Mariprofundus sp. NF]
MSLALKYEACRPGLEYRPSFNEVRAYRIKDEKERRNARAFKILAIFLAVFATIALPLNPSLPNLLNDREFVSVLLRMILGFILFSNFFARNTLYKEEYSEGLMYSFPLMGILDVYIKTGWFVKGSDFISLVVNLTTAMAISGVVLFLYYI